MLEHSLSRTTISILPGVSSLLRGIASPHALRALSRPLLLAATWSMLANVWVNSIQAYNDEQERLCYDRIQNRVAWNHEEDRLWEPFREPKNISRLCRGTSNAYQPVTCFWHVMTGQIDWGGGTRWDWNNAVDLCAGTNDHKRTILCFQDEIEAGETWRNAIQTCRTRKDENTPSNIASQTDLVLRSISAPEQVRRGRPFRVIAEVQNIGNNVGPRAMNVYFVVHLRVKKLHDIFHQIDAPLGSSAGEVPRRHGSNAAEIAVPTFFSEALAPGMWRVYAWLTANGVSRHKRHER